MKLAKEERAAAHAARERERAETASAEQRERDAAARLLAQEEKNQSLLARVKEAADARAAAAVRGLLVRQVRRRQR